MASILLTAAGGAVGGAIGGPAGALFGRSLGQVAGNFLGGGFGKSRRLRDIEGPRLAELGVQTSTYGKMIPIAYGTVRIAGNIVWSRPIREVVTTASSTGGGAGKGGGKVTQTSTTYSYFVSLAIGICEGPVTEVLRVWADAKQLDLSQLTIRLYKGDETQLADAFIQGYEGVNSTPAYRGLAYAVIEDFPLAEYGNRIPNFTFEVKKKALYPDYNGEMLEEMVKGMTLIPGAGEYVYDTQTEYKIPGQQVGAAWVQQGDQQPINLHTPHGKANALVALDQLKETCPNLTWVSVVAVWFGDTMDAATCLVKPGVEYQTGATTGPDIWQSAGYTRSTARQITLINGSPQYGGTPDDDSVLRLLDELKARGYNIMFYPMMFMDTSGKPWRGNLTGTSASVATFFTKSEGYNAFITHYANLVKLKVDAFVIGSELKGLTKVMGASGVFPAVNELVTLAATVKGIVGSGVKVTYAADWSEYHHEDNGWYNLDPLWASANIDIIGIDAYFPLTDAPQPLGGFDIPTVIAGWTSGEGYDWYYSDAARTTQASLAPAYAWKNLSWFWNNTHTNPNSQQTAWVPQSKKIWFTEVGFPSVDGAANQPNVFYDPSSTSSALPYYSKGRVDFRAQRVGLVATEQQWKNSTMVERMFVWTWDARPYPYWPDLTGVWADGGNWKTGHWIQGKLGISSLAAIVADLMQRAGLIAADFDVSRITGQVEGFVISGRQTIRRSIEQLQAGYFFDAVESDNLLKCVPRGGTVAQAIPENDLAPPAEEGARELLAITRAQEIELPRRVNVVYLNRIANYQPATQYAERQVTLSRDTDTVDLPLVLSGQSAKVIADVTLFDQWVSRTVYQCEVSAKYARLEPSDIVTVTVAGVVHRMRIVSTHLGRAGVLRIRAVADDVSAYDFYTAPGEQAPALVESPPVPVTRLELLDIPAFPSDAPGAASLRFAGAGLATGWTGAVVYRSDDGGGNYQRLIDLNAAAVLGNATTALPSGPTTVFDDVSSVTVLIAGDGTVSSTTELGVLNGANAALLGSEIVQFKTATLVEPGKYTLSGLLRGRLGTEWAVGGHAAGERFVLLDGRLSRQQIAPGLIGLPRKYKPVTLGATLAATTASDFTYTGVALKPLSPVHIAGSRDGSGNLTIAWVRRTRLGGDWQDNIDAPLNEAGEAYEVDIMNGGNVARTLTGLAAPTAGYTAAQQTADFGSAQSSVTVRVYQLSALVGRGYKGEAAV